MVVQLNVRCQDQTRIDIKLIRADTLLFHQSIHDVVFFFQIFHVALSGDK